MKKAIRLIPILLILSMILCGCSLFGVEDGFIVDAFPAITYFCAYKSDKRVFDIDDVRLTFYYGSTFSKDEHQEFQSYPSFDLRFTGEEKNTYYIRTVEENFISDKFNLELKFLCIIKYNHSEEITIPKEIFTKESGVICFGGYGVNEVVPEEYDEDYPAGEEECIFSTYIFYKVKGDKVILSNRSFEK